jgi:enterobactin synthetase component D
MPIALHLLPLPAGDVLRIHLVSFESAGFDVSAFDAAGIACPPEVARSVVKRQAEFFFGRLAARAALCDCGQPLVDVPVGPAREPVWPPGIIGSISHVNGLAAAVVGQRTRRIGLGIDLERTAVAESQAALRKLAVDVDELKDLQALDVALTLNERVTLVFSAKESLYKALRGAVGRFFGFEAVRVEAIDERRGVVSMVLTGDLRPAFARGRRCEAAFARLDAETFVTAFEARDDVA